MWWKNDHSWYTVFYRNSYSYGYGIIQRYTEAESHDHDHVHHVIRTKFGVLFFTLYSSLKTKIRNCWSLSIKYYFSVTSWTKQLFQNSCQNFFFPLLQLPSPCLLVRPQLPTRVPSHGGRHHSAVKSQSLCDTSVPLPWDLTSCHFLCLRMDKRHTMVRRTQVYWYFLCSKIWGFQDGVRKLKGVQRGTVERSWWDLSQM